MDYNNQINGQYDIYDWLKMLGRLYGGNILPWNSTNERANIVTKKEGKTEGETISNYLGAGERLNTLAKEKFNKLMNGITVDTFDEKLLQVYSKKDFKASTNISTYIECLAKSFIRPQLKKLTTLDENDAVYTALRKHISIPFSIREAGEEMDYSPAIQNLKYRYRKDSNILILSIYEEGFEKIEGAGYKNFDHAKKYDNLKFRTGTSLRIVDIAICLSWMLWITIYDKAMNDPDLITQIRDKIWNYDKKRFISSIDCRLEYLIDHASNVNRDENWRITDEDGNMMALLERLSDKSTKTQVCTPYWKGDRPSEAAVSLFKQIYAYDDAIRPSDYTGEKLREKQYISMQDSMHKKPYCYIIPKSWEWLIMYKNPSELYKRGLGRVFYNRLLSHNGNIEKSGPEYEPDKWMKPAWYAIDDNQELLMRMAGICYFEKLNDSIKTISYYKELTKSTSHAKSYQTKKAISNKMINYMEKSDFNKAFGYVEVDNDCDIEKVTQLSAEFLSFKETFLPGYDSSEVSLRFRKLGNHKALGLFYPSLNCLCVDINSPSSFLHEYGHSIDYILSGIRGLSSKDDFSRCLTTYKECVLSGLSKEDNAQLKDRLNGTSKYNLSYYFTPAEVFARCFEMYVVRILKVNSSICKPDEKMGVVYPKDDRLEELLKKYFDKLFDSLKQNDVADESDKEDISEDIAA